MHLTLGLNLRHILQIDEHVPTLLSDG